MSDQSKKNSAAFDRIRMPLAIFLSSLVFMGYLYFNSNEPPVSPTNAPILEEKEEDTPIATVQLKSEPIGNNQAEIQEETFYSLTNNFLKLKISSHNAAICEGLLHFYSHRDGSLLKTRELEGEGLREFRTATLSFQKDIRHRPQITVFSVVNRGESSITLLAEKEVPAGKIRIEKHYELTNHSVKMSVKFYNPGAKPISFQAFMFNGSSLGTIVSEENRTTFDGIKLGYNIDGEYQNALKPKLWSKERTYVQVESPAKWIAIQNRFYIRYLFSEKNRHASFYWKKTSSEGTNYISAYQIDGQLSSQEARVENFEYFYMPKSRKILLNLASDRGLDLDKAFDQWTIFKILSDFIYGLLIKIDVNVKNFGWTIVIMTFLLKIFTFPLTHKSYVSMQKMQALSPKMTEIRRKYKKSPPKANQEIMALYRKEKVNPAMGCIPMLIPIPFFFAMYSLFQTMIELDGATFLWITNLALADHFWKLPLTIPIIGDHFNLLPPLMGVSQFLQSMLTPSTNTGNEMAETQAKMMKYFFPILFLFICWSLPAALVMFWFVQNILSIFQTLLTKRRKA